MVEYSHRLSIQHQNWKLIPANSIWIGSASHKPQETPQLNPFYQSSIRALCKLQTSAVIWAGNIVSTKQEKHNKLGSFFLRKSPGLLDSSTFPQPAASSLLLFSDSTHRAASISQCMGNYWEKLFQGWFQPEVKCCVISSYLLLFLIRERRASQWSLTQM